MDIVDQFKHYIDLDELESCKLYLHEILATYEADTVPWDYIYKNVYLHACLRKRGAIVNWILELYESLPPIEKIALSQVFPYGRHLLKSVGGEGRGGNTS
jgi:hypothetical protein